MKEFDADFVVNPTFQTVTGLTNKTFNANNIVSGRAATEDQLLALYNNLLAQIQWSTGGTSFEITGSHTGWTSLNIPFAAEVTNGSSYTTQSQNGQFSFTIKVDSPGTYEIKIYPTSSMISTLGGGIQFVSINPSNVTLNVTIDENANVTGSTHASFVAE